MLGAGVALSATVVASAQESAKPKVPMLGSVDFA
jgi:hypothetical protein